MKKHYSLELKKKFEHEGFKTLCGQTIYDEEAISKIFDNITCEKCKSKVDDKPSFICAGCDIEYRYEDKNFYEVHPDELCQDCFDDSYFECDVCGKVLHMEIDGYKTDGDVEELIERLGYEPNHIHPAICGKCYQENINEREPY